MTSIERRTLSLNQTLSSLVQTILNHRPPLFAGLAATVVSVATLLLGPRILGQSVEILVRKGSHQHLFSLVAFFAFNELVRVLAGIQQAYQFAKLGQGVMTELRERLFLHIAALPISVLNRVPKGKLVTRVINDTSALNEVFAAGMVSVLGNLLSVAGICGSLVLLSPRLAFWVLLVFPPLLLASYYFSRRLSRAYIMSRKRLSILNAYLAENLEGMRVVRLFGRSGKNFQKFSRLNEKYSRAQFGVTRVFALFQPTITLSTGIAMAVAIAIGGGMVTRGEIQTGIWVSFFAYILALFQPVVEISDKWNLVVSAVTSAERIYSLFDLKPEYVREELEMPALPVQGLRGHLVFENVSFSYDGKRWALRNFSLEIAPGKRVAIVGPTGSGKSTLLQMLLRFQDPTEGRILLDGKDITEIDKRQLRASLGWIQQDVFLFSGSLRENITLGRKRGDLRLEEWLQQQQAIPQLTQFSGRLDEPLLERGANLSMGEKQLIAFARVLYRNPSIWLLDEATSNIDPAAESKMTQLLREVADGRTRITIAHRLGTVQDSDQIVVLQAGQLMEVGTHHDLLAKGGVYASLTQANC